MILDNRTLLLAVASLELLGGLMILTVLGQRHGGRRRMGWAFSFLLQGCGVGLIALRDLVPPWLSIPVANALYMFGGSLLFQAFAHLLGRRAYPLFAPPGAALFSALQTAAFLVGFGLAGRTLLLLVWTALLQSGTAWLLLNRSAHHPAQRITGLWFLAMAAMVCLQLGLMSSGLTPADSPITNSPGRTTYMLSALAGILIAALGYVMIENELNREELAQLARLDSLTGALNRRALDMIAGAEWERHVRYMLPLAVVMVDIDHFKAINDGHGHSVGDDVLRHFAQLLRNGIRQHEVIVRYGGEEFLILAPNTDMAGAVQLAERLQELIRATPYREQLALAASFGVAALVPSVHNAWESLVETADRRLYRAKAAGRDCIVTDDAPPPEQAVCA